MKHIVIDARIRRSSTGRYTDRLIQHLQEIDHDHRYTVLVQPDDLWQPTNPNWTVVPCPYPQFSLNPLNEIRFARQLRDLQPDLVHFTMTQQPLLFGGSKIVTTTHDLTMLRFVRANTTPLPIFWIKRAMYRVLFSVAHRKSDAIITPTQFVKEDLAHLQPFTLRKTHVTLEAGDLPSSAAAEPLAGIKKPFIFYVGSAFPHKNLFRLVDAFGILHERMPDLQLAIVGKREFYKEELERYITSKVYADSIVTPGFISDGELRWMYENCAAYVFPSESEGFGLPGLEAMAHKAPLVSSNATCSPEVYGDAAEYFDPLDIQGMADAIERVVTDKKLRTELIERGNKQIKKFSWERMATETKTIYDQLLG